MTTWSRVKIAVIVILSTVLASLSLFFRDRFDAVVCDALYARAAAAADSLSVDNQVAPRERGRGEYTSHLMTCGEVRRLGSSRTE